MNDLLKARLRKRLPETQDECCAIAARQSIASLGAFKSAGDIRAAARGIAEGLFGEAFQRADDAQRKAWVDMAEREYRKAIS